jgi:flavin-binding protein dodecin
MMDEHVYKKVQIVGTSPSGTDEAIRNAIATASKTLRHVDWYEVVESRGHVADGQIAHFQVTLNVAFRLES